MNDAPPTARRPLRYLVVETAVNTAISVALSGLFAWLFFHGRAVVDLGSRAVVLDLMPQAFAVGLMSFLVPTLLTRKRRRAGTLRGLDGAHAFPRNALSRSAVAGIVGAVACTAIYATLGPSPGAIVLPLAGFVMLKGAVGAVLSITLTPVALLAALRDPS